MNLGTILRKFYLYIDDEVQDYWTREKAVEVVNDGMMEVYRTLEDSDEDYFIKCVEYTITADDNGERIVTLPDDFKRVQIAERKPSSGSSNVNPIPVTWVTFSQRHAGVNRRPLRSQGLTSPLCWLAGNKIGVINPSESFTLSVWYSHVIPALDTDNDVPESISVDYHNLIALEAAKTAMAAERRSFSFEDMHQRQLATLAVASKQRQRHQPRYVHMSVD
jgi:hypothetical protein